MKKRLPPPAAGISAECSAPPAVFLPYLPLRYPSKVMASSSIHDVGDQDGAGEREEDGQTHGGLACAREASNTTPLL